MSTHQSEFACSASVFNLAAEAADDPWRLERERLAAEEARVVAIKYQSSMQRALALCPGFVGADAPTSDTGRGRLVVEPAKVIEALAWLRRRFHVSENLELSSDAGLCIEVQPRVRRSTPGPRRAKPRFKLEQFELDLSDKR